MSSRKAQRYSGFYKDEPRKEGDKIAGVLRNKGLTRWKHPATAQRRPGEKEVPAQLLLCSWGYNDDDVW